MTLFFFYFFFFFFFLFFLVESRGEMEKLSHDGFSYFFFAYFPPPLADDRKSVNGLYQQKNRTD